MIKDFKNYVTCWSKARLVMCEELEDTWEMIDKLDNCAIK